MSLAILLHRPSPCLKDTLGTDSDRRRFLVGTTTRLYGFSNRFHARVELLTVRTCSTRNFHLYLPKYKMSDKEIETTKGISNETVCNYFYVLFIIVSILAGLGLINDVRIGMMLRPSMGIPLILRSVVVLSLAVANTLFLYIMCARSLLK